MDEILLLEGLGPSSTIGMDWGMDADGDFLAFLGDLTTDPVEPAAICEPNQGPTTTLPESTCPAMVALPDLPAAASSKVPALVLPPPAADVLQSAWQVTWQVTTVQQQQVVKQESVTRASPCSSAASADATNCPESPLTCSGPVSSRDTAPTAPVSVATNTRKRQRTQKAASPATTPGHHSPAQLQQQQPPESAQESEQEQLPLTKAQLAAAKRRAPVVDWRAIDDPEERRKQRRLAKNRVTAARSRERKKEQMAEMEERMSQLEAENSSLRALLQTMMTENTSLKEQLASLTRGAAAAQPAHDGSPKPAVLVKCLAIMHLVACLMCARASLVLVAPLLSVVLSLGGCGAGVPTESCGGAVHARAVNAASSSSVTVDCDAALHREWWRVRLRPMGVLHAC